MLKHKIKFSTFIICASLMVAGSGVFFSYFYLLNKTPVVIDNVVEAVAKPAGPKFLFNIDGSMTGSLLNNPLDVDVNGEGRIFVADTGNNSVKIYDPNGTLLQEFGKFGRSEGEFDYPNTITVDDKHIYVGEFKVGRIQIFDHHGNWIKAINSSHLRTPLAPLSIDVNNSKLYVANRTGEILIVDPQQASLIKKFGKPGIAPGFLSYPNGIFARNKKIFVSDSGNKRLQVFSSEGKFIRELRGSDIGVSYPRGIDMDSKGQIYIADVFSNRIVILDEELNFLQKIGKRGLEEGEFNFPNSVSVFENRLYVADRENNRIVVFKL